MLLQNRKILIITEHLFELNTVKFLNTYLVPGKTFTCSNFAYQAFLDLFCENGSSKNCYRSRWWYMYKLMHEPLCVSKVRISICFKNWKAIRQVTFKFYDTEESHIKCPGYLWTFHLNKVQDCHQKMKNNFFHMHASKSPVGMHLWIIY